MSDYFNSVHVYTENTIAPSIGRFRCFSSGWQTYIPQDSAADGDPDRDFAKKLSKIVPFPVLWFWMMDSSEKIYLDIFIGGRAEVSFCNDMLSPNRGIFKIPALVGYPDGHKRHISNILACGDAKNLVELLEEFFGVCLLPENKSFTAAPHALRRYRGEEKYKAYLQKEQALSGANAPMRAELIKEIPGKIFVDFFGVIPRRRQNVYLYGYDSPMTARSGENLLPVEFKNGALVPISAEAFYSAPQTSKNDPRYIEHYHPVYRIEFTEEAPAVYRGKTITPPPGFYAFDFDERGRFFLSSEKNKVALTDENGNITAKICVKGQPVDMKDGFLLTVGPHSVFAYYYDPGDALRIYRLYQNPDKKQGKDG